MGGDPRAWKLTITSVGTPVGRSGRYLAQCARPNYPDDRHAGWEPHQTGCYCSGVSYHGSNPSLDFLLNHRAVLDLRKGCRLLEEQNCTLPLDTSMLSYKPATLTPTMVIVERKTHTPPNSEMEILGQVKGIPPAEICLLESAHRYPWLEVARASVRPHERSVPVRALNTGVDPITLFRGQVPGTLDQADPLEQSIASVQITNRESALSEAKEAVVWEMIDQARTCLDQTQKNQLFSLLTSFSDVVSGNQDDFGRTS